MQRDLVAGLAEQLEKEGLLPLQAQAELSTAILKQRLETVLPWAMQESQIDFWVVAARENCPDPILKTLLPWDMPTFKGLGMLVFHRQQETGVVRKMVLGPQSKVMSAFYERVDKPDQENLWQALTRLVKQAEPGKIAVNRSRADGFSDGLSSTMYEQLKEALAAKAGLLVDGQALARRWLARSTPLEKRVMEKLAGLTHSIIEFAFSRRLIKPGQTLTTDLEWFMRNTLNRLGFSFWFGPDVDLQRRGKGNPRISHEIILPGDLIHCDLGLNGLYLQLHTDVQRVGYLLQAGEKEAPRELGALFKKGLRLQDIVRENMRPGLSGNEVLLSSLKTAKEEGIKPMIYSHPLGAFGHGAGPVIGRFNRQAAIPGAGDLLLAEGALYALELNVSANIKAWGDQLVFMFLEEDVYLGDTVDFIRGRQEDLILI